MTNNFSKRKYKKEKYKIFKYDEPHLFPVLGGLICEYNNAPTVQLKCFWHYCNNASLDGWKYSSVVEHSTADQDVTGLYPVAPFSRVSALCRGSWRKIAP